MNFYNTLFPSDQTQSSKVDLQTVTEDKVIQNENEEVGIVLVFLIQRESLPRVFASN